MKGQKTIQFIKSPVAVFHLAYFADDIVTMPANRADVLIEAGFAKEYAPAMEIRIDLPEDIPARDKLLKAGVKSLHELNAYDDLTQIPSIGPATAKAIAEYLKK